MQQIVSKIITIQAAASADGFRRGVADHDPWLVLNMANFTFEGQPLNGFNRLASHQVYGFSSAFTQPGAKNARTFAIFAVRLWHWSRKID